MLDQPQINPSPFHPGEQAVQERLGVRDIETWARQVVRDHLPDQHRSFHTGLPFLIAAARDSRDRPWATVLTGPDGFVTSPDPRRLRIAAQPVPGDALEGALSDGADLGILGIELVTRRRNRVNGRVATVEDGALLFEVDQAFGNCPQYIRERAVRRVKPAPAKPPRRGRVLTQAQRALVAGADTFFIASGYRGEGDSPTFGMDASHRGGDRGFVEVVDGRHLRFPDYAGNNHFNTIGNLLADPRAGMLFIDFTNGSLLQLTGRATIDWASSDLHRFPGARRLITLEIDEIVDLGSAIDLRWQADADSVRSLRLVDKRRESDDVVSFLFEARDGGQLPPFEAGQHLPLELRIPGHAEPVARTYSLSGAPGAPGYRISVKREPKGLASRFLHDCLEPGAIIDSRRPGGDFVLEDDRRPIVLVSAGIGVTPMASMLQALAAGNDDRPVWFVQGARDGRHHPLRDEIRALVDDRRNNTALHVAYSRPASDDVIGRDFDSEGRVDADLLMRLLPMDEAVFYLCGPTSFMADIVEGLRQHGVPADRIHSETFGPVA